MMINYAHHGGSPLKIPQCNMIKQCVMKMGEDTIEGVCEMFSICYSSLNAFLQFYLVNLECRSSKEWLAYHLMHGHQTTSMLSWP
jgi:molybdopterin/thiamine biosynthesis adenylyltransferase